MRCLALNSTDVTAAAIVAGRVFMTERTAAELLSMCEAVDGLSRQLDLPLGVVIGTQVANFEPDETLIASVVVGLVVAATDAPEPEPVDTELLRSAASRAAELPWAKIDALVGPFDFDGPPDPEIHVYAAGTGAQAGVHVAYGVIARDESEAPAFSPGSPQSREPALAYVAGKDMEARRVEEGVWGVPIAYAGDWEYTAIDRAIEATEEYRGRLGSLGSDARYYLMPCFG